MEGRGGINCELLSGMFVCEELRGFDVQQGVRCEALGFQRGGSYDPGFRCPGRGRRY